jgi:O-antigen/teichoic acid export membrane protein
VRRLALLGLVPVAVVMTGAPFLIELVLGPQWESVGTFMQILMFWKYFQFLTAPVSATFSIVNRQEIGVALMIASALVRFGAMYFFSSSPTTMLLALSIAAGLFNIVYNLLILLVLRRRVARERSRVPDGGGGSLS